MEIHAVNLPRMTPEQFERRFGLWLHVQPAPDYCRDLGPCRVWSGGTYRKGYGRVIVDGHKVRLHRLALETFRPGELTKERPWALHRCDVPACVAERHLWAGTVLDNNADMMRKGRDRHPTGEQNYLAKLTVEQVREIRRSCTPLMVLARTYQVHHSTIQAIIAGRNWAHVKETTAA